MDNQDQDEEQPDVSMLPVSDTSIELESAAVIEPAAASSPGIVTTPLALQTFDEVTESPKNAPGSGRRHRVAVSSIFQSSSQLQEVQNSDRAATPVTQRKRKRGESGSRVSPEIRPSQTPSVIDDVDELSPEQPVHRGRRPKVVQKPLPAPEEVAQDEEEYAEAIDDEEAAVVLKKNRGRRTSKRFAAASPDLDALDTPSTLNVRRPRKRNRVESSPVQQRHPKAAKSQAPKKSRTSSAKLQIPAGGPVPVTVHRLTLPPLYDENESDADILNAEMPHMKRSGVNAIDVLTQVCQEIIGLHLNSLEQMGNRCEDTESRREYKTKWNAVEAFGKELQLRLLTQVRLSRLF